MYINGVSNEIGKLFTRLERFMARIAGEAILDFDQKKKSEKGGVEPSIDVGSKQSINSRQSRGSSFGRTQPKQTMRVVKDGVDIM